MQRAEELLEEARERSRRASRRSWERDMATGRAGERALQAAGAAIKAPMGSMSCTWETQPPSQTAAGREAGWGSYGGL